MLRRLLGAASRRRRLRSADNVLTMQVYAAADALRDAGADQRVLRRGAASACARCPASRRPAPSTICRSQGGSVQPIVLEGRAELLPRDQPTVAVRKITPGYLHAMRHPAAARPRRRDERRRRACWSAAARRSCCGATPIRSAGARRCRSSRRRCMTAGGRHRRRRQAGRAGRAAAADGLRVHARARSWSSLALVAADARCRRRRWPQSATAVVRAIDPEQPVEDDPDDGRCARRDADVAALQRAAARRCSRASRWRSRRSASTACCRTSCAAAAARSASAPRSARGPATSLRLVVRRRHDAGAHRHRRRRVAALGCGEAAGEARLRRQRLRSADARGRRRHARAWSRCSRA